MRTANEEFRVDGYTVILYEPDGIVIVGEFKTFKKARREARKVCKKAAPNMDVVIWRTDEYGRSNPCIMYKGGSCRKVAYSLN